MSTPTSAPAATDTATFYGALNGSSGKGAQQEGQSVSTFFASVATGAAIFAFQFTVFLVLRTRLSRVYEPRTYLVPDRIRTNPAPKGPWQWLVPVLRTNTHDFIKKCGLDAYFFLRYLRMLLKIFIPAAFVIVVILVPLNKVNGRGSNFATGIYGNSTTYSNVTGLDQLAWGNVRPTQNNRYWAHLILAVLLVIWVCFTFWDELRGYIRVRQAYLTSPEHRIKASATTVLVTGIPHKWLTFEALDGLYDVFPGGIRNIWINRNYDSLSEKVKLRNATAVKLEKAYTALIRNAKKAYLKRVKKTGEPNMINAYYKARAEARAKAKEGQAGGIADEGGISSGDPHQVRHTLDEALAESSSPDCERRALPAYPRRINGRIVVSNDSDYDAIRDGNRRTIVSSEPAPGVSPMSQTHSRRLNRSEGLWPFHHRRHGWPQNTANSEVKPEKCATRPEEDKSPLGATEPASNELASDEPASSKPSSNEPVCNEPASKKPASNEPASNEPVCNEPASKKPASNEPASNEPVSNEPASDEPAFDEPASSEPASNEPNSNEPNSNEPNSNEPTFPGPGAQESTPHEANPEKKCVEFAIQMHPKELDARPPWEEDEDDGEPTWKQYLRQKDRQTMRLPIHRWLPSLPLIGKKVDTIDYCREELARLNVSIEEDQRDPEKFRLMNSAFIQFNNQVAAHMACQAVSHHSPNQMTPRLVEISPEDVIWDNMSLKWWESYLRTAIVTLLIMGLVIGWAIPVTFTGLLSQVRYLSTTFPWLAWLARTPTPILAVIQGVLPQTLLGLLLYLLPMILRIFVRFQGNRTGTAVELSMQNYYFFFLFVQVFLVVSISSGITTVIQQITKSPQSVPSILAQNLPKASNYFFSYLLLQALSTSAGALMQIWGLIQWFVIAPLFDNTARQKWRRQTALPIISWGTFFPVFTNLAAIGLIYSVISPLILVFCIVTFGLFWIVYRYNTLYVTKFRLDTGGLLFPKAVNQLFTGLYVMELCLIGLFFLVRDVDQYGNAVGTPCKGQAIVMIVVLIGTIIFQWLLNASFSPLFRYLPITLEDEAVERDELFALAHERRWNRLEREDEELNSIETAAEGEYLSEKEAWQIEGSEEQDVKASKVQSSESDPWSRESGERQQSSESDLCGIRNFEEWEPRARKYDGKNDPGEVQNTSETDIYGVSTSGDRRRRKNRREYYKHLEERQQHACEAHANYVEARNEIPQTGGRDHGCDGNNDHADFGEGRPSADPEQGSVVIKHPEPIGGSGYDHSGELQSSLGSEQGSVVIRRPNPAGGDDRDGSGDRFESAGEQQSSVVRSLSSDGAPIPTAPQNSLGSGESAMEAWGLRDDGPRPLLRVLGYIPQSAEEEVNDLSDNGPRPLSRAMGYPPLSKPTPKKMGWAEQSRKDWAARSPRFAHTYEIRERKHTRLPTDLEDQCTDRLGRALFSGIRDELADLNVEERDKLVQHAFQPEALRSKRPVIWIPRDELGVSDDEIYRCQRFSKHVWISNYCAALDGKGSVVFARGPPDFDEIDLIEL